MRFCCQIYTNGSIKFVGNQLLAISNRMELIYRTYSPEMFHNSIDKNDNIAMVRIPWFITDENLNSISDDKNGFTHVI